MAQQHERGRLGETLAAEHLRRSGYSILAQRWRRQEGEIDIIASEPGFLCFVEVKLRKNTRFGEAREAVTPAKQRHLRNTAIRYLTENPSDLQPRFDVIEVYAPAG